MAISKRLRYEVLRRDNYTCRYCGAKPPEVKLVPDHVVPKALGGSDTDPANFVAACEACNSGKTSSSPDAPLVADVAEDALKWATAMKRAQVAMIADIKARETDRAQFQEWWDSWGYGQGDERQSIPKDPAWWVTVDQFIAAGLPLPVIKDCIELAMTRHKIRPEDKFKYMCGIAWSKVTEMQKSAQVFAGRPPSVADEAGGAESSQAAGDAYGEGRSSLASELLSEISDEDRAYFLECADVNEFLGEDEQRTKEEEACEAASTALNSARTNLHWLVEKIGITFKNLPPEIGQPCLADMKAPAGLGDPLSRMAHEAWGALLALDDLIDLPTATTWAATLKGEEKAEWLDYARALNLDAELSPERLLVRAWDCSRVVADDKHYKVMCKGRGMSIPACPLRGTHVAVIAELDCCNADRADDHGHSVCEKHLEQLMDGTFISQSGRKLSAIDFTEIPIPEDAWAPF